MLHPARMTTAAENRWSCREEAPDFFDGASGEPALSGRWRICLVAPVNWSSLRFRARD